MCGKFTQMSSWRALHAFSQPLTAEPGEIVFVTPMRFASVLRLGEGGAREVVAMRWGFSDQRAANPARPKHMHARSETIDTRAAFADAFAHRRGILQARTFNEGEELPNGRTKQWVITPRDGAPLAIAVIWEEWESGEERLPTFVMVTAPPNALIARVTDRMPALLGPEDWPVWLGETGANLADVKALLKTCDDQDGWTMAEQAKPAPKPKPRTDLL